MDGKISSLVIALGASSILLAVLLQQFLYTRTEADKLEQRVTRIEEFLERRLDKIDQRLDKIIESVSVERTVRKRN